MTRTAEMEIKLARLRALMAQENLDAVYLKRQDDFAWLTCGGVNFLFVSEMGMTGLLVTADAVHAVTTAIEAPRMMEEEGLEELGVRMHADVWHHTAFEMDTVRALVPSGRLGADFDFPGARVVTALVKPLRYLLTEGEVARYREGARLARLAVEETASALRPGDTEWHAIALLQRTVSECGMRVVSAMCAADDRIARFRHPVPTARRIEKRVQLGGNLMYKGLVTCLTRFVSFGKVPPQLARQYRVNAEIDAAFALATRTGVSFDDVLATGRAAYAAHGFAAEFDKHHVGGPIGYLQREFRVDPGCPVRVSACQAVCWNPSITGTKSEDTLLVTEAGFEYLTLPTQFPTFSVTVDGRRFTRAAILEK